MQSARNAISLIAGLLPIAYCGGLIWYFTDKGGLSDPLLSKELQPTIVGLAFAGFVFIAFFAWRIWRGRSGGGSDDGAGSSPQKGRGFVSALEQGDDADHSSADAMIARYLAQRSTPQGAHESPVEAPPRGATFGRRIR
ncbi:MAG: hypothetical protein QM698_08090 [Micropepsaceae bacterium]